MTIFFCRNEFCHLDKKKFKKKGDMYIRRPYEDIYTLFSKLATKKLEVFETLNL